MALWVCRRVELLPILLGLTLAVGIIVTYIIAVCRGDVTPYMPFISEAGAKPPESGIFSLFLLFGVIFGLLSMLCRFSVVLEMTRGSERSITILNAVSLIIGIISLMGMAIVACYPMISIETAHNTGAYVLFILGIVYSLLQTVLTYKMYPMYNGITIFKIRLAIASLNTMVLIGMMVIYPLALEVWQRWHGDTWRGNKEPDQKGFTLLTASGSAEWMLAILFIMYFFTFIREFKKVHLRFHVHVLVVNFDDPVDESELKRNFVYE